jgi:hypothetical protein
MELECQDQPRQFFIAAGRGWSTPPVAALKRLNLNRPGALLSLLKEPATPGQATGEGWLPHSPATPPGRQVQSLILTGNYRNLK